MNKEITLAYINYWQDPKNDKYFSSMKQKILFELHRIKKNKF